MKLLLPAAHDTSGSCAADSLEKIYLQKVSLKFPNAKAAGQEGGRETRPGSGRAA